jgi:hypothetical protein
VCVCACFEDRHKKARKVLKNDLDEDELQLRLRLRSLQLKTKKAGGVRLHVTYHMLDPASRGLAPGTGNLHSP